MKKLFYAFAVFILIITACTNTKNDKVKIGMIAPLTGEGATYGAAMQRGAELVFKNDSTFQLISEDSKLSAKEGINAFNKLVNADGVKVVFGAAASSVSLAIAPQANKSNVILFSSISTADDLSEAGDYFFRNVPKNNVQGKTAAKFLKEQLGISIVAVFSNNNDYGISISGGFREVCKEENMEIIFDESYNDGSKDFKASLIKLKDLSPEAVFIPGYYKESTIILKQAREIGLKTIFIGGDGSYSPELIQNASQAAEGFYCTIMNINEDSDYYKNFYSKFKKAYNQEPDVYDAYAYEASMILKEAINKAGQDANLVKEYLLSNKFESLTGEIGFESNGDINRLFKVVKVENNEFK
jgi:branched-chain amino acid transport system substrate-binding protein